LTHPNDKFEQDSRTRLSEQRGIVAGWRHAGGEVLRSKTRSPLAIKGRARLVLLIGGSPYGSHHPTITRPATRPKNNCGDGGSNSPRFRFTECCCVSRLSTPSLAEATETDKTTCRPFWDPGSLQQAVYSVRATAAAANWTLPAVVTGRRLRSVQAQVFCLTRRPPPPVSLFPCGNKPPANQVGQ